MKIKVQEPENVIWNSYEEESSTSHGKDYIRWADTL